MIRFASTVLQVSHEGAADGFFHREHLLVDRLADDDGEGARLDRLVDVLQLRHAAGRDHGTGGDAAGPARRRLQIRARAHADGLAAQKIDCGEYQHGARLIPPSYAVMKAASRAAPASWLFSGWNWQAKTLSRATAEQNVSPWSVSSATSSGRAGTAKLLCTT